MTWKTWLQAFEDNAANPLPAVSEHGVEDPRLAAPLARSLAIFQLGEAGEGRIAKEVWGFRSSVVDDDWRRAMALWVREESRHGMILGHAVRALGGHEATENWTNDLLVWGRRLFGLRLKLLVILTAEVVGITFYRALAGALGSGDLARALDGIAAEEERHLSFHTRFFALETASARGGRALFTVAWWIVGLFACGVVLVDHHRTLRRLGLSSVRTGGRFCALLAEVASSVRTERAPKVGAELRGSVDELASADIARPR